MKGHFSIGILLLFCAYGALCASNLVKRDDEAVKKLLLDGCNRMRQMAAVEFNISNMHELTYDNELEKEIKAILCNEIHGVHYYPYLQDFRERRPMEMFAYRMLHNSPDQQKKHAEEVRRLYSGFMDPVQTKLGCAERPDCKIFALCGTGPNKGPTKSNYKTGVPGSACLNGKTDSGMCKAGPDGSAGSQKDASGGKVSEKEAMEGQKEDNGSNHFSIFALLLIVFFI
ncbi:unnamed protein product [Caenorhabditis nigoni]